MSDESAETTRLLKLVEAGDRSAFDQLFGRHRSQLLRMIDVRLDGRLRTRVDPSDVVQETHLVAYRRINDYLERRPMPFRLWLRKTAQERLSNFQRDHIKAERRSVLRERRLPDRSSILVARHLVDGTSPSNNFDRKEFAQQVASAVNELSETDREALLMRFVDGLSHVEIAQLLEIEHATARQRYGRAIIRLREVMANKGIVDPT